MLRAGKVVGSVCHGPAAFVNVKVDGDYIVKGRQLTAFSDSEEQSLGTDKVRLRGSFHQSVGCPPGRHLW